MQVIGGEANLGNRLWASSRFLLRSRLLTTRRGGASFSDADLLLQLSNILAPGQKLAHGIRHLMGFGEILVLKRLLHLILAAANALGEQRSAGIVRRIERKDLF